VKLPRSFRFATGQASFGCDIQASQRLSDYGLCSLHHLLDMRRRSVPVTINNTKQVNIAADGGQQVNAVKVEE